MKTNIILISLMMLNIRSSILAQTDTVKSIMTKKYDPSTNLVDWPEEFNPTKSKWFVYNEIEINATPEVVWQILTDATKWHTYYKGVQSPVTFPDPSVTTLGKDVSFNMHTMGLRLTPVIKEFVPNQRMAWEVRRKDLTAWHTWVIVPTPYGCRLITPESQNGFLTFMQKVFQPNKLLKLHDVWLRSIKYRAEQKQKG